MSTICLDGHCGTSIENKRGVRMKEMCREMKRLRRLLTQKGIKWVDNSDRVADRYGNRYWRTRFRMRGVTWYVNCGAGSKGYEEELLELIPVAGMNPHYPVGYLTAEGVLEKIDWMRPMERKL